MADITFLELVPIVLSIFLFKQDLSNKQILFHADNKALVCILNKKSSKSRQVMGLIRHLVLYTMLYNMQFKAMHIEGRINCIADAISCKQWQPFRSLVRRADTDMTPVPQEFVQLILDV